ncbi:hypothetical protein CABS01_03676 [Colletotrichum abscissum]|uniref:RNase III domain-containing protein n=1 Tax=Colletotrichum abscissum TaxID=1671311 RepID=A0A9P9XM52_9PEZI|nr:uncharacterized protein CABS01_03676 [Colletotrichum abscissum]KAI3556538.1 hypothetical protein CABS02_03398 [Colletotrichum abscissum]KAK1475399.1 hypothetical protein CABS01_03676 [Colletotrichum abscissum]
MQAYQDDQLNRAEHILDYRFNTRSLLLESLQTPGSGVRTAGDRSIIDGNKTLALLGDKVLGFLLVEAMVRENLVTRGDIDAEIQLKLNNARLVGVFDMVGFLECLGLNPSQGLSIGPRTKADTIEAIIGAAYLDGGFEAARLPAQTKRKPGSPALGHRGIQTEIPSEYGAWHLLSSRQIQRRTSKQTGVSLGVAFFSQDLLPREPTTVFLGDSVWGPWCPDAGVPGFLLARGLIAE